VVEAPKDKTAWIVAVVLIVQTIFVGVSAFVAALAYSKESWQRRQMRTLDLVRQMLASREGLTLLAEVRAVAASRRSLQELSDSERVAVSQLLNEIEFLAVSLKQGEVNEDMLRSTVGSYVVGLWGVIKDQIMEERKRRGTQDLWTNVEWLAYRWQGER
jgi:hypothetical protein